MARPMIDILLATYNGERYLAEQIDSLFAQTVGDWRLIARDDGSSDATVGILRDYAARHPGRVVLVEDGDRGLGACANFGRLMEHAEAEYVMFCDQDDVWLPDKIETLMAAMSRLEAECGRDRPLLVHSDLRVVGPNLEVLHPSFWEYQGRQPDFGQHLNRLLIRNVVTGCASLCNRALVVRSRPIPLEALMHDWWVALVAAAFGRTAFVTSATVLYRQHGGNASGAKPMDWRAIMWRGCSAPAIAVKRHRQVVAALIRQARAFLEQYGTALPQAVSEVICCFASLRSQGILARRLTIARHRFLTKDPLPNLLMFLLV